MQLAIWDIIKIIQEWTNANEGFVGLLLFFITLLFGWVSGIFNSLIKKPKLKVRFLTKATFYSTFPTGETFTNTETGEIFELHKTAFAVQMSISNVGNVPTSVDKIFLGYFKNSDAIFSKPVWLPQTHVLDDFAFRYNVDSQNDVLLFLNHLRTGRVGESQDDYLEVGKSITGVAYFEQNSAWGNFHPKPINDKLDIEIIIKIRDVFDLNHKAKTKIKIININEARIINPNFGIVEFIMPK